MFYIKKNMSVLALLFVITSRGPTKCKEVHILGSLVSLLMKKLQSFQLPDDTALNLALLINMHESLGL